MKICMACGQSLAETEFHIDNGKIDRLKSKCKKCLNAADRKQYNALSVEEKAKESEKSKLWVINNLEQYKQNRKNWRKVNRELCNEYARTHYHKYKEKYQNYKSRRDHIRRAQKAGSGGTYSKEEFEILCEKYNFKCLACGKSKRLGPDHVIPLSLGGTNDISNMQPLCKSCNSRKHIKTTDYRIDDNELDELLKMMLKS